jgi:NADP-dependent 3-hydroxy acid dehydrogenase YdfG
LSADDVAEVILFCATRPPHVDVADIIVMPTDQASVNHAHRTI